MADGETPVQAMKEARDAKRKQRKEAYYSKGLLGPQDLSHVFDGNPMQSLEYIFGIKGKGKELQDKVLKPSSVFLTAKKEELPSPVEMPEGLTIEPETEPVPFFEEKDNTEILGKKSVRRGPNQMFKDGMLNDMVGMRTLRS